MHILGFLLLCIVAAIAVVVATIIYFIFTLHRTARRFMGGTASKTGERRGTSRQAQGRGQKVTASDMGDEELYDTRSQQDMQKKIFPKDEGEYVDYEDVH